MVERRSSKRWRTADYSRDRKKFAGRYFGVYNRNDDSFMGYLIDISSEGMMILSKNCFPEGTAFKMRIELPEEIKGSDQLLVEARAVWCERDTNPEYNRTGLAFTFTFPHHAKVISLLFEGNQPADAEMHDNVSSE